MSIWVEIRHPKNWIRCTSGLCFPVPTRISGYWQGSLNVPIEHHPTIRYMVYNGYYKVMSNIPKMGHLPTPDWSRLWVWLEKKPPKSNLSWGVFIHTFTYEPDNPPISNIHHSQRIPRSSQYTKRQLENKSSAFHGSTNPASIASAPAGCHTDKPDLGSWNGEWFIDEPSWTSSNNTYGPRSIFSI